MTTHLVPIYQSHLPMYYMDHLSTIAVIQDTSSLVPVPVSVILPESLEHLCQTVNVSFNLLFVPPILKSVEYYVHPSIYLPSTSHLGDGLGCKGH